MNVPDEVKKAIDTATAEVIKEIPGTIRAGITSIVAQSLGFKYDDWSHKWEVDHCNGREPAISQIIKEHTKDVVKKTVAEILTDSKVREIVLSAREGIERDFRESLSRKLHDELKDRTEAMVKDLAIAEVERLKKIIMAEIGIRDFDPDNPDHLHKAKSDTELTLAEITINKKVGDDGDE
jgi:hypothetical protein